MKRVLFFLGFFLSIWGQVNKNNDVQLWIGDEILKQVTSNGKVIVANEWRFGNDISRLYHVYIQGLFDYRVNECFSFAPAYRQNWIVLESKWREVYEPFFEVFFTKKSFFEFRNRISYLMVEAGPNLWQYRPMMRLIGTWKWKNRILHPYISSEFFIRSKIGLNQARASIGIGIPFLEYFRGSFYYMLRFLKPGTHWTHQHVFGTWLRFRF